MRLADGQTFVVSDGSMLSTNPLLYAKLPYDPKDIAPVAFLAQAPLFLAVHPKLPVATLKEFIDYVKARPGQITTAPPASAASITFPWKA